MFDPKESALLFSLLPGATSIGVVSELLKRKGLHYSAGSWKDLKEKRLQPALDSGELTELELLDLLRSGEEHGRQHVFLYECAPAVAATLMERARIRAQAAALGVGDLLEKPKLLEIPSVPTLVDIRWRGAEIDNELVIKQVERRVRQDLVQIKALGDGRTAKEYLEVESRAVSLARLRRGGSLEIRIGSHETSTQYANDLGKLWEVLEPFLPREHFNIVSLAKAKLALFDRRAELTNEVRFSDTTLVGSDGVRLKGVSDSPGLDLYQDTGVAPSFLTFQGKSKGYIEGQNIILLQQEARLSKDARVMIQGDANEFAITANCNESDYEYILGKIQSLNS
jgi:hypothetical protein